MTPDHALDTRHAPRALIVAITRHGALHAQRLAQAWPEADVCVSAKFASLAVRPGQAVATQRPPMGEAARPGQAWAYTGSLKEALADAWPHYDQLVCFVSLGAVVRLVAPLLKNKDEDPGVTVVDDASQFVIPMLSGHVGGANDCAVRAAQVLGAQAVLTTASDVGHTIPVDILGRHLGWRVEAPKINLTRVSAHVVNGEPVAVVQEAGSASWWTRPTPLPANIHCLSRVEDADPERFQALLWITDREVQPHDWARWPERLVVYRTGPLALETPA